MYKDHSSLEFGSMLWAGGGGGGGGGGGKDKSKDKDKKKDGGDKDRRFWEPEDKFDKLKDLPPVGPIRG